MVWGFAHPVSVQLYRCMNGFNFLPPLGLMNEDVLTIAYFTIQMIGITWKREEIAQNQLLDSCETQYRKRDAVNAGPI